MIYPTVFNIDNKNNFLSTKISILEWFLKDHLTVKTEVWAIENPAFAITGINNILKYIKIENSYFTSYFNFILLLFISFFIKEMLNLWA